jgi:hypothetical protein
MDSMLQMRRGAGLQSIQGVLFLSVSCWVLKQGLGQGFEGLGSFGEGLGVKECLRVRRLTKNIVSFVERSAPDAPSRPWFIQQY